MTKVLFQKSITELRDAFALRRLQEEDKFADAAPAIDEWLAEQSLLSEPNWPVWCRYVERVCKGGEWSDAAHRALGIEDYWPSCLSRFCIPLDPNALDNEDVEMYADTSPSLNAVVAAISPDRVAIYRDGSNYLGVCKGLYVVRFAEDAPLFDVQPHNILMAILASWSELSAKGANIDKKYAARQFLIDWLGIVIRLMREAAYADFEAAVMVSVSGRRVASSDFVFVYSKGNPSGTLYPAQSFVGNKLRMPRKWWTDYKVASEIPFWDLLSQCGPESLSSERNSSLLRVLHSIATHYPCYIRCAEGSFFCLNAEDCPSPLPVGGKLMSIGVCE